MKLSINIKTKKSIPLVVVLIAFFLIALYIISTAFTSEQRETIAAWQPVTRPGDNQSHNPTETSTNNSSARLTRSNETTIQGGAGGTTKDSPKHSYYSRGWNAEEQWWQLSNLSTLGFERIELTFSTRGSDTGPRNFALEYKIDGNEWIPLLNSNGTPIRYVVDADNRFHAHGPFLLNASLNDLTQIDIRFYNIDDQSVVGDIVKSSGTNYISDIILTGIKIAE